MKCNECYDMGMILMLNAGRSAMRSYLHDACGSIPARKASAEPHSLV